MNEATDDVIAMGEIEFDGNIIPHTWFDCPLLKTPSGRPNTVAILLLADLVYWYRPVRLKDEITGETLPLQKKFAGDKLQKHYDKWGEAFGFTKRQAQEACYFLRDAGLITIEARTVEVNGRPVNNVMHFAPIVPAIKAITFKRDPYHIRMGQPSQRKGIPHTAECETYTKNRSEITNTDSLSLNVSNPPAAPTINDNGFEGRKAKAVAEAVAVTRDTGSKRRFAQLYGICEENGGVGIWQNALDATRRRRDTLDRPGAYFCKMICDGLLDRGVSVPVGTKEEREEVKRLVRESLG